MIATDTHELALVQATSRRFVTEEVIPLRQEHDLDADQAPPKELRQRVRVRSKELGLYAIDMQRLTVARRLLKEIA